MRSRCLTPTVADYPRYGGAGIKIDPSWDSFEAFLRDMGQRPSAKHSLDRIDPTGHYTPENCRWTTTREQNRNKRRTIWITAKGETRTLQDWAERLGVRAVTLDKRYRAGWPDDEIVTRPVSRRTPAPA